MGDLNHAKKIISKYYTLSKSYRSLMDFAVKFQFRDLNTFINHNYTFSDHKQVKRFVDTKLSKNNGIL